MPIRNAAKAIILDHGRILVNRNQNTLGDMCYGLQNGDVYYDLPGGGQNQYETLEDAVRRECLEETGHVVRVERLCAIFEEISHNERFRAQYEQYAHKVHFVFLCRLTGERGALSAEMDLDMLGSEWIRVEDIKGIPLYPERIRGNLDALLRSEQPVYLGSELYQ